MLLKEAKKLATLKWVCVHTNGNIYEHKDKPYFQYFRSVGFKWQFHKTYDFIGIYSGKKPWSETLRKV